MKKILNICGALLFASVATVAAMAMKRASLATDYNNFSKMEWYYDADNQNVVVYLDTFNSSIVYSAIVVKPRKEGGKTIYDFAVLTSYGGEMNTTLFKLCADRGVLVSFPVKDFHLGTDKVVYAGPQKVEHEIPFRGGMKEALSEHKLLPPNWHPPTIKGIPGLSDKAE